MSGSSNRPPWVFDLSEEQNRGVLSPLPSHEWRSAVESLLRGLPERYRTIASRMVLSLPYEDDSFRLVLDPRNRAILEYIATQQNLALLTEDEVRSVASARTRNANKFEREDPNVSRADEEGLITSWGRARAEILAANPNALDAGSICAALQEATQQLMRWFEGTPERLMHWMGDPSDPGNDRYPYHLAERIHRALEGDLSVFKPFYDVEIRSGDAELRGMVERIKTLQAVRDDAERKSGLEEIFAATDRQGGIAHRAMIGDGSSTIIFDALAVAHTAARYIGRAHIVLSADESHERQRKSQQQQIADMNAFRPIEQQIRGMQGTALMHIKHWILDSLDTPLPDLIEAANRTFDLCEGHIELSVTTGFIDEDRREFESQIQHVAAARPQAELIDWLLRLSTQRLEDRDTLIAVAKRLAGRIYRAETRDEQLTLIGYLERGDFTDQFPDEPVRGLTQDQLHGYSTLEGWGAKLKDRERVAPYPSRRLPMSEIEVT